MFPRRKSSPPGRRRWRRTRRKLRTRNYVELQLTRARLRGLRAGVGHAIALFPNDPLVFDSLAPVSRGARRF